MYGSAPARRATPQRPTVRAHDHTRTQVERRLTLAVPPDAGDAAVLDHQALDGETLPQLGSRLDRGGRQLQVEHGAPRGVGERGLVGPGCARDRHGAEVKRIGVDARTARGQQPVEQAPLLQRRATPGGWTRWVEIVSEGNVALSTTSTL